MSVESTARKPIVFWHIVEESLEDAEFLWTRWERFLDAHDLGLEKIFFWVEQRLHGALDGLGAAGDAAFETVLEPALASDSPGAVAAAAHVLATSPSPYAFELLARALTGYEGDALKAVARGIEVADGTPLIAKLSNAVRIGPAAAQASLLDIYAFRGIDPGSFLLPLIDSPSPLVRAAAVRASRFAPSVGNRRLEAALSDSDPNVVVAAVETGLIRGIPEAWNVCLNLCAELQPAAECRTLLPLLAMSAAPRAQALLRQTVEVDALQRDAVFALGISGRAEAAQTCIELMREGRAVKVAADAFCTICGLDLVTASLAVEETAPEPPPTAEDDDLEADLVPSIDDALPLPQVEGVVNWWEQHKIRFTTDRRYLGGKPVDLAALQQALAFGPARWRHAQARELAIRSGGAFYLATRAFTREQQKQLGRLATATPDHVSRFDGSAPLL